MGWLLFERGFCKEKVVGLVKNEEAGMNTHT